MIYQLIKVLIFVISNSYAIECEQPLQISPIANLDNFAENSIDVACAEYEKRNKCLAVESVATSKLDPEALAKKLILRDKAKSEDKKDRQGSLINQLYTTAVAEDPKLNKEKFESMIKERLVDFVKIRKCEPAFGRSQYTLDFDDIGGAIKYNHVKEMQKSKSEVSKLLNENSFKQKANEKIREHNKENFYNFLEKANFQDDAKMVLTSYCTKNLSISAPAPTQYPIPNCKSSISKYFVDNKAELRADLLGDLEKDRNDLIKCIKDNEQAGYKISKINIKSSANQLRNTSSLEDIKNGVGFCGFDFLGLSTARANYAKDKILPNLISLDGAQIKIDPNGKNGNGSSGPCPYDKNGNLLKEFTGAGKNKLEEYKATDIEVEFEATQRKKTQADDRINGITRVRSSCASIRIKCKDEF